MLASSGLGSLRSFIDGAHASSAKHQSELLFSSRFGDTLAMDNENQNEGAAGAESLVVASKLKAYIRTKSQMNTSASVVQVLSDKLREMCDQAIENAKREGRKTVMDRDFTMAPATGN